MQRACDSCGAEYEAKRPTSRYCKDPECVRKRSRERMRSSRGGVPHEPPTVLPPPDPTSDGLYAATLAELEVLGLVGSQRGQQALTLAAQMASSSDTGSSIAAVSKELSRVMDEIRAVVPAKADPLDELRQRRERRTGAA